MAGTSSSSTANPWPWSFDTATGRAWLTAAKQGDDASLQRLLQQHPDLLAYQGQGSSYGFSGNAALHWAAAKGHGACGAWLLEQGADVHQRNFGGSTPLHSAASNGQEGTAQVLLLQGGADPGALDGLGDTPRGQARQRRGEGEGAGSAAVPPLARRLEACVAALELQRAGGPEQWPARAMRVLVECCEGGAGGSAVGLERRELQALCQWLLQQGMQAHPRAVAAGPAPPLAVEPAAGGGGPAAAGQPAEQASEQEQAQMQQRAEEAKRRGNQAFAAQDFRRAAAQYTLAVRLQPGSAVLHSNRSAAYCSLGDWQAALRDGHRCLELQPGWPKGLCRVAAAYLGLGQYKEALKGFKEALAADGEYVAAKQGVAQCMERLRGTAQHAP
jgi:hypothetical protein